MSDLACHVCGQKVHGSVDEELGRRAIAIYVDAVRRWDQCCAEAAVSRALSTGRAAGSMSDREQLVTELRGRAKELRQTYTADLLERAAAVLSLPLQQPVASEELEQLVNVPDNRGVETFYEWFRKRLRSGEVLLNEFHRIDAGRAWLQFQSEVGRFRSHVQLGNEYPGTGLFRALDNLMATFVAALSAPLAGVPAEEREHALDLANAACNGESPASLPAPSNAQVAVTESGADPSKDVERNHGVGLLPEQPSARQPDAPGEACTCDMCGAIRDYRAGQQDAPNAIDPNCAGLDVEDATDSPEWLAAKIDSLQARDWRRVHDPRQQQDAPSDDKLAESLAQEIVQFICDGDPTERTFCMQELARGGPYESMLFLDNEDVIHAASTVLSNALFDGRIRAAAQQDESRCDIEEALKGAHAVIIARNSNLLTEEQLLDFAEWIGEQKADVCNSHYQFLVGAAYFRPSAPDRPQEVER